jgi:hypothetical protein
MTLAPTPPAHEKSPANGHEPSAGQSLRGSIAPAGRTAGTRRERLARAAVLLLSLGLLGLILATRGVVRG